ncbi:MAG: ribosome maturation factor RimM, partial [Nostocales cyanobacterium]
QGRQGRQGRQGKQGEKNNQCPILNSQFLILNS